MLITFLKGLASEVAPQCRFDTTVIKRIGAAAIESMEDTLRRAYAVSKAQALKAGRQELRLTDTDLGMAIGRLSLRVVLSESVTPYTAFLVFCFVSFAVAHPPGIHEPHLRLPSDPREIVQSPLLPEPEVDILYAQLSKRKQRQSSQPRSSGQPGPTSASGQSNGPAGSNSNSSSTQEAKRQKV